MRRLAGGPRIRHRDFASAPPSPLPWQGRGGRLVVNQRLQQAAALSSQHRPASQQGPLQAQGPPASQAQPAATHSQASQRQTSQQSQVEVAEATGTAPRDANRAGKARADRAQRTANFFMEKLRTETKAKEKTRACALTVRVNFSSSRGQPGGDYRREASIW
jgi:hypothetical protein